MVVFQIFWFGLVVLLKIVLRLRWSISSAAFILHIPPTFALEVNWRVTECPVKSILLHIQILASIRIVLNNDYCVRFLRCFC